MSEDKSQGEENPYREVVLRLLNAERYIWEEFIREHTPPNESPPFLIICDEMDIAQASAAVEHNRIAYTARVAFSLPIEEFKAVLAHELGHIINRNLRVTRLRIFFQKRARTGVFLYCAAVMASANLLFVFFKDWLKDWEFLFLALTSGAFFLVLLHQVSVVAFFVAARREEYNADKYAVSITCPGILARALVKIWKINGFVSLPRSMSFFQEHPHPPYRLRYLRRWRDEKRKNG